MTIKYVYSGKLECKEEIFGSSREHMTDMIDNLADQINDLDEVVVLVVGRKGADIEVTHLITNPHRDQKFVDIRQRTNVLGLTGIDEARDYMETARHLLHVDCNETETDTVIQTVIDVGNSEGLGHSFSIEHKVGN